MPPKRKAAAAKKGGPAAKKGKKAAAVEEEEAPETMKDKISALKAADKGKVKKHKPDSYCRVAESVSSSYSFTNTWSMKRCNVWSEAQMMWEHEQKSVPK